MILFHFLHFKNCLNLREITLPDDLNYIGREAFSFCEQLKDITFGDDLQFIEDEAFLKTNIETVEVPKSVILVGDKAFGYCHELKEVNWETTLLPSDEKLNAIFEGTNGIKSVKRANRPIALGPISKGLDDVIDESICTGFGSDINVNYESDR